MQRAGLGLGELGDRSAWGTGRVHFRLEVQRGQMRPGPEEVLAPAPGGQGRGPGGTDGRGDGLGRGGPGAGLRPLDFLGLESLKVWEHSFTYGNSLAFKSNKYVVKEKLEIATSGRWASHSAAGSWGNPRSVGALPGCRGWFSVPPGGLCGQAQCPRTGRSGTSRGTWPFPHR